MASIDPVGRSAEPDVSIPPVHVYAAPVISRLGTLAELTLGGDFGPDDGLGGAGDEGSL